MVNKKVIGKKSRAAGIRFEKRVRNDLEREWIIDKWTNNIEFMCTNKAKCCARLIPAKPKFVFNPKTRTRQMIGNSSGFPDFIALNRIYRDDGGIELYQVTGIEVKMNGYLDKEEREKCRWLLDNQIFNSILIAKKGTKRGQIEYIEFHEKLEKFK